jgi:Spy/CpxP family protein refolding chaperone
MKRFYRDFRLAFFIAALSFVVFWLVGGSLMGHHAQIHDPHHYLHEKLGTTTEQDKKLIPIEEKFSVKKQELETKIMDANHELAEAINKDGSYSVRVKTAVEKIHMAQGELQKATLEHLFEMHSLLTPEQRKKLNLLTTDALTHN